MSQKCHNNDMVFLPYESWPIYVLAIYVGFYFKNFMPGRLILATALLLGVLVHAV